MKLANGFITHDSEKEHLVVATSETKFSGLVKANSSAAYIISLLKEDTTEEKIIEAMLERYDAPREILERDVKKIISQLDSIGAIEH